MAFTHKLTDKLILLIVCTMIFGGQTHYETSVVPLILTIIISSLISYLEWTTFRLVLQGLFMALCFSMPELMLFIPLLIYDLINEDKQWLALIFILPVYVGLRPAGLTLTLITAGISLISIWLKKRTGKWVETLEKYHSLQDDARELSNRLTEQNRVLLNQQESEIHLATLKERNRIAREIHDNVGHQLSRAILQVGALMAIPANADQKEGLSEVNKTLTQAMTSIRESVHDLHEKSIDLTIQIQELIKHFTFCEITFENGLRSQPENGLKITFIAIIKEALSNIIKHSNADHVEILLREHPAFYQLIIRDNGLGKTTSGEGMGLINMSDRVYALNGNINIQREKGFEIFITIPKEEAK